IELRRPNSGLPHEGSFFGKEVHVFSDATVLHLPLDWDFLCPAGDKDGDGVFDCWDECPGNDQKSLAGVCGCLEPDVDADGDGVPECGGSIDQCDGPASYRGQCGCSGESEGAAPAGTPCNDGIAAGVFECDGNGTCGNPDDVAPEACCKLRTLGQRAYWICDGCDGGGAEATQDEAVARCAAVPGRSLVRIDDRVENQLLAGLITFFGAGPTRIGGLDGDGDGSW